MTKGLPWISGPGEILKHGSELLKHDTDTNRRLAMISIDNAVELMIKTYLGLPKRITGLSISRHDYQEFSESFPKLLDAFEKHATNKLVGIDLGLIEWYHRLRNELYHQGNGLTVERDRVNEYAELAYNLFASLFGVSLSTEDTSDEDHETSFIGRFMKAWIKFEEVVRKLAESSKLNSRSLLQLSRLLEESGLLSKAELGQIDELRTIRNELVHLGTVNKERLSQETINDLISLTSKLEKRL